MVNQNINVGDYVLFTDELIEYAKAKFDEDEVALFLNADGKAWKVIDIDLEDPAKTSPFLECAHGSQEFVFYSNEIKFLKIIGRKAS